MASSRADLTVSPFYHQAKNEIVQPGQFVACSRYFVRRWMPLLGGTGTALVLYLRSLGYYNPHTGELRDGVRVGMKDLAAACGVSDRTIQRELDKSPWLPHFVRVESSYEQLPDGRVRHHENLYRIAMDDPLHPEDEPRLQAIIAEREQGRVGPEPPAADQRVRRIKKPAAAPPSPVNDILSPPSTARRRHSVTTVASKCRLKDSTDIPDSNILSNLPNNSNGIVEAEAPPDVVVDFAALVSEMTRQGVSRVVAEELAAQFRTDEIRLQLESLPFRDAKDPAAVLVKSIREGWAPPPSIRALRRGRAGRQNPSRSDDPHPATAAEEAAQAEKLRQIEAYWNGLTSHEQSRISAEAREALRRTNPFVAQLMERAGEGNIVRATLESLRHQILRERLGLPAHPGTS